MADKTFGSSTGLTILAENQATPANGMVAYVTSSWNSGYQNGDIKGAFLSDTDDTDLTYTVLNNTTDYTTEWSQTEDGWTINATSLVCDGLDGSEFVFTGSTNDLFGLPRGSAVVIKFEITSYTSGNLFVDFSNGAGNNIGPFNSTGVYTVVGTVGGGIANDTLYLRSDNFAGTIENIEIAAADADRSVNNNGLIVNGTVTRTPVATGADLVAYSGFSASNYLEQPYNADLDFGTGDFCVMGWVKDTVTATDFYFDRMDVARSGAEFGLLGIGNEFRFIASSILDGTTANRDDGNWHHVVGVRRSGVAELYVDGVLNVSQADTGDLDNASAVLVVGAASSKGSSASSASLALLRISATAPTAEAIEKIYNDEKHLFTEGAQATLFGASDAVTALAFDDSSQLLHVGTSAGRSVFQGLRRVSNTTTAVGTAISAANNLVVEE